MYIVFLCKKKTETFRVRNAEALNRFERKSLTMLFLTNELAKKAEITILSARDTTRPGPQAGALWMVNQGYIRAS